jgi:hypothetical protein
MIDVHSLRGYDFGSDKVFQKLTKIEQFEVIKTITVMRREFSKLIHNDFYAFQVCLKEYQASGKAGFPQASSGKPSLTIEHLAHLLARYENRNIDKKTTKDEFCEDELRVVFYSDTVVHQFHSPEAVERALKSARRLKSKSEVNRGYFDGMKILMREGFIDSLK